MISKIVTRASARDYTVYDKNQFCSMELSIWGYAVQDIHAKYNFVGIDFLSIWFNSIWFDFGFSSNKAI